MSTRSKAGKFETLDALRGVLAIVVCIAHAWQHLVIPVEGTFTFEMYLLRTVARLAVLWFFVLSGYVISLSIQRNTARNGSFVLADYALSRVARIVPPLVFALLLVVFLELLLRLFGAAQAPEGMNFTRTEFHFEPLGVIKCVISICGTGTLIGGVNGPLWSLGVEIQLYVIVGLMVAAMHSGGRMRKVLLLMLLVYLLLSFRPLRDGNLTVQPLGFFAFAAGWAVQRFHNDITVKTAAWVSILALLVCVGFMATTDFEAARRDPFLPGEILVAQLAFCLAATFAVRLLTERATWPWLAATGHFSYTLYIIHYPLLLAGGLLVFNNFSNLQGAALVGVMAMGVVITTALAWIVGKWVERPRAHRAVAESWLRSLRQRPAQ